MYMNASHRAVTEWGLRHVTIDARFTILDVGCGGGGTVATLACMNVKVYLTPGSDGSCRAAREALLR